jgi:hypothetical protein
MTRWIAHHLACPECAAALAGNPGPPGEARCVLILDEDQDPAVRCPHPRDGDSDWCEVHGEAIAEQVDVINEQNKAEGEADALTQAIAEAGRKIATARMGLRAFDRGLAGLRRRGTPAAEIVGLKMQRKEAAASLDRVIASKAELEARLAVLRSDGQQ